MKKRCSTSETERVSGRTAGLSEALSRRSMDHNVAADETEAGINRLPGSFQWNHIVLGDNFPPELPGLPRLDKDQMGTRLLRCDHT